MGEEEASTRRLSQVMAVDVHSMLNSLKELEQKLTEHHKLDMDLTSVLPRLDLLEKQWRSYTLTAPLPKDGNEGGQHSSYDEDIFEKVQKSIEFMSEKHQLTLESKLSSVSLELDRVHKLLSTRPTTSDLSKIMLSVQDVNMNLMKTISDNANYMQSAIKDLVAEEMTVVIDNIKSSGELNLKGVDGLLKQIDNIAADLLKTRNVTNAELKSVTSTINSFRERLDDLFMRQTALKNELESNQQDSLLPIIDEMKSTFIEKFNKIFTDLELADTRQQELESKLETQMLNMVGRLANTELSFEHKLNEKDEAYRSIEQQVVMNEELLRSRIEGVHGELEEIGERLNAYVGLLQQLKAADVVKTLNKHTAQLNEQEHYRTQMNDLNTSVLGRLRQLEVSAGKVEKDIVKASEDISTLAEISKNQIEAAIDKCQSEAQAKIDGILSMIHHQDVEMADSKELVNSLSSTVLNMDQKLKMVKKEHSSVEDKLEEFQSVTNAALRGIEAQQHNGLIAVDALTPKIEYLSNKLRTVANSLEKNEEDMSRLNQRFNEEDSKKRATKVFGQVRQTSFRKPRRSIESTMSKVSTNKFRIQPKSFEELKSDPFDTELKPLAVKMKKVEIAVANNDEFLNQAGEPSPLSAGSRRQEQNIAVVPNDDMYFEELPDFDDDLEEIKEEILSQAEYTAELCVNYEESSLKHSRVLELPKAICEHMVQTAQALAAFASNSADAEVVLRVLRASPNDLSHDENTVNSLREEKLETFLSDVISAIEKISTREPGIIRAEARDRFLKKLRTALVLCMSKHDQVKLLLWVLCSM